MLTQATATAAPVSYVVRPGDTLTAIAEKHKTTVRALAKANDLKSVNLVVEGAKLRVPGGAAASGPAEELSRSTVRADIDRWAAHYGIPANLARALAWQESGFQTNVTSSVGAWGPMQVIPSTWAFVETMLLGHSVPKTGEGGVEVGMALLNHLLKRFNGDQRLALAAWYQGEKATREVGLYDETKVFVANVLALDRPSALEARTSTRLSSWHGRDRDGGGAGVRWSLDGLFGVGRRCARTRGPARWRTRNRSRSAGAGVWPTWTARASPRRWPSSPTCAPRARRPSTTTTSPRAPTRRTPRSGIWAPGSSRA